MPYEYRLPSKLKAEGWKVKILDKEELEPPHATIFKGPDKWRLGLRDGWLLVPPGGSWNDFPKALRKALKEAFRSLGWNGTGFIQRILLEARMNNEVFIVDGTPSQRRTLSGMGAKVLGSKADVTAAVSRRPTANSLWITLDELSAHWLAQALANSSAPIRGRLLAMKQIPAELVTLFADRFDTVALKPHSLLPITEIYTILLRRDREEFCIGCTIDQTAEVIICVRGDLSVISAPLSFFETSPVATPDFNRFEVIDHGRTIRLGKYQAAFSSLLYERDTEYRRRLKRMREESDRSFSASMRRLRKQRGLRLSDFGAIEKTVARIERGEVKRPRKTTVTRIAKLLRVSPEQIAEY